MRFLHISDTHYLKDYATNHDGFAPAFAHMTNPLEQLKKLLAQVDEPFDFVVHSGDLTHDGTLADYLALQEDLQALLGDVPLLTTPGNHDDLTAFSAVFAPTQALPLVEATQFDGLQVIGFDSSQTGNPNGAVTAQVCQRLLDLLAENPAPAVLFTHHHLNPNQFELSSAAVDGLFHQVMAQPQVVALLTGHTHQVYADTYDGKPYYTGASISFVVKGENQQLVVYETASLQVCAFENGQLSCRKVENAVAKEPLGVLNCN